MQPLTPAGLDLRDFPYMPLDVVRLRDSDLAILSSGEGFRAAVMLWCAAWHQVPAASLPNDDRLLANLAGFGRDIKGWKAVRDEALRGFIECNDGRLYHRVIAEKAIEAMDAKEKQRLRTQAAAEARRKTPATPDGSSPPRGRKRHDDRETTSDDHRHILRHDERHVDRNDHRHDARNEIQGKGREEKGIGDSSESAASEGCARARSNDPDVLIRTEIMAALAGDMPPGDMHRPAMWLAQGYSLALIRAVVVERLKAGRRPSTLAWFDKALAEAAAVKAPEPSPAKPADDRPIRISQPQFPGDSVVDIVNPGKVAASILGPKVREYYRSGVWPEVGFGRPPGAMGCHIPPSFLAWCGGPPIEEEVA